MRRFMVFITAFFLSSLLGSSSLVGGSLLLPPASDPPPQKTSVRLSYNSQHQVLAPEQDIGKRTSIRPMSIRITQNILPAYKNTTLDSLAFVIDIYALSNNAPSVAPELVFGWKLNDSAFRIGIGGISSLETNAWRLRGVASHTIFPITFLVAAETLMVLDIPTNWITFHAGGAIRWSLFSEMFDVTVESRIATLERWEAGSSLALHLSWVSFRFGWVWQKIPSGFNSKYTGAVFIQL
ncbi:MAG: hypothetical protein RBS30_10715 [Sphaerochaetaceae bacterium]|nr:hypothetical protein [Sphaerochaetaceae bacterium]